MSQAHVHAEFTREELAETITGPEFTRAEWMILTACYTVALGVTTDNVEVGLSGFRTYQRLTNIIGQLGLNDLHEKLAAQQRACGLKEKNSD